MKESVRKATERLTEEGHVDGCPRGMGELAEQASDVEIGRMEVVRWQASGIPDAS